MTSNTTPTELPGAEEWFGTPEWQACLLRHDREMSGCPGCASRRLLARIHRVVFSGDDAGNEAAVTAWLLQDGYGTPGFTPPQGWDWSGIRDSSPRAIHQIAEALGVAG